MDFSCIKLLRRKKSKRTFSVAGRITRRLPFEFIRKLFHSHRALYQGKKRKNCINSVGMDGEVTVNQVLAVPGVLDEDGAWRSIFVDLTRKGSMTYLIFIDCQTHCPEVFELGVSSFWKETKGAFRDVFREYRIPAEILTPPKVFFANVKLVKFIKSHGIVQVTDASHNSDDGREMTKVLNAVKTVIHSSRFWHDELRKLRDTIAKRALITENKYVQAGDKSEEDIMCRLMDSSTEDSCESKLGKLVSEVYPDRNLMRFYFVSTVDVKREPLSQRGGGRTLFKTDRTKHGFPEDGDLNWLFNVEAADVNVSAENEGNTDYLYTKEDNIETFTMNNCSTTCLLRENESRIKHSADYETGTVSPGRLTRTIKFLMNQNYCDHKCRSVRMCSINFLKKGIFRNDNIHINKYDSDESMSSAESAFEFHGSCSGDKCALNNYVTVSYPINALPLRYDNMFITNKDLNWKVIAVDVVNVTSDFFFILIDFATKYPEISHKYSNSGDHFESKLLIDAICHLWQRYGKPIEVHASNNIVFTRSILRRFLRKFNMFFYYDSPYLRDDVEMANVLVKYKKLLGRNDADFNVYKEFLGIQSHCKKAQERRAKDRILKCAFNYKTETEISSKKTVNGILRNASNGRSLFRSVLVDQITLTGKTFVLFLDAKTCFIDMKQLGFGVKLQSPRFLIKALKDFFNEKAVPEEVHGPDCRPFNTIGVIRFLENNNIQYYRQSQYFNSCHYMYMSLQHLKHLLSTCPDVPSALRLYHETPLPWLRVSPKNISSSIITYCCLPPWDDVVIDVFRGRKTYLLVFDYGSLYAECFRLGRNVLKAFSRKLLDGFKNACAVLGCPSRVRTTESPHFTSNPFIKLLKSKKIQHLFLKTEEVADIAYMKAKMKQKLSATTNFREAVIWTRQSHAPSLGCCPTRRLRAKETEFREALLCGLQHKKVSFNLPKNGTE